MNLKQQFVHQNCQGLNKFQKIQCSKTTSFAYYSYQHIQEIIKFNTQFKSIKGYWIQQNFSLKLLKFIKYIIFMNRIHSPQVLKDERTITSKINDKINDYNHVDGIQDLHEPVHNFQQNNDLHGNSVDESNQKPTDQSSDTSDQGKSTSITSSEILEKQDEILQFWQSKSQKDLGISLQEVCDNINEIIHILPKVLEQCPPDLYNRFASTKYELQSLFQQIQVVVELLLNCRSSPSDHLQLLQLGYKNILQKELYQSAEGQKKFIAQKSSDVNIMMVSLIKNYMSENILPALEIICSKTLNANFNKRQLLSDIQITVQIINKKNSRLKKINFLLPSAVDMSQTEFMCQEKNHQDWKQVYAITDFKKLGEADKVNESYEHFAKLVILGHALISSKSAYRNTPVLQKMFLGAEILQFILLQSRTMQNGMNHISELEVDNAIQVIQLVDFPVIKQAIELTYPKIAYNKLIYIDPVVMPITIENQNKGIKEGTINIITPIQLMMVNLSLHQDQPNQRKSIFIENKSKLQIRLLCNQKLRGPINDEKQINDSYFQLLKDFCMPNNANKKFHDTIMIHIHGGGFIAQSSSTHQCHTREWSNVLGIPIFSIDYSLSPQYPYPIPLDDCWQAYHWIINYVDKYFNIKPKTIILAGDSAGGNLCVALTALLIKYRQRVPDGIFLAYVALDIRYQFSPCYLSSLDDKILSHTLLAICLNSYSSNQYAQIDKDPFMSPILLSDEIFQQFPPTRMICGSKDPLIDHTWKLGSILQKLGIDSKITIYEELNHGFLNFNTVNAMQEIRICIKDSVEYIQELIDIKKNI